MEDSMKASVLVLALLVLACVPARAADRYTIDPESSIPVFQVLHLGFTTQRGRFDKVAGTILIDAAAHRGSVDFRIDAGSLDMGSRSWTAHLADEKLFNTLKFPTIVFHADDFRFDGDRVVGADGDLTMIGITRRVHVVVERFHCGLHPQSQRRICGGDIHATLRRSEFGLLNYLDAVGDEVRIDAPILAYAD
jgi:polyisoprenoid-binding protein YceI